MPIFLKNVSESGEAVLKFVNDNKKSLAGFYAATTLDPTKYEGQLIKFADDIRGDFNDNPISYSRYRIAQVLQDCFTETGRGFGLSYNQKGFFVRIDHILVSDHFEPFNCQIDSKMDASDHYPIICTLKMDDNP
jgi:hypothetical protein